MDERYRPRAQPDIPRLRPAAEVEIVEVKIEALAEPQFTSGVGTDSEGSKAVAGSL